MKALLSLLSIWMLAQLPVSADDSDLPKGAADLAMKLAEWEANERSELEKRVAEQREKVIAALNTHLAEATKAGDLDGALAIRELIASLDQPNAPIDSPADPKSPNPETEPFTTRGETWEGKNPYNGADFAFEVQRDGSIEYTQSGNPPRKITITRDEGAATLTLASNEFQMIGGWQIVLGEDGAATFKMGGKTTPITRVRRR